MSTDPECPDCGIPLEYRYSECGDDDEFCDCDEFWRCMACERRFVDACGAHVGTYPDHTPIGRHADLK